MRLTSELVEGVRISLAALRANKLRAGLTTLGVVIGIVTVTLMATAIEGLNRAFMESVSMIGTDVLFIQRFAWFSDDQWWKVRNRRELNLADARAVARESREARAVSAEAMTITTISYEDRSASAIFLTGCTADFALVRGLSMAQGRFFSVEDVDGLRPVCVIGHNIAEGFFPGQSPLGEHVRINQENYQVIGTVESMGQFFTGFNLDNQVFIPITRLGLDFAWQPEISIAVKVADLARLDETKEELRGIMRKRRRVPPGDPDNFAINEQRTFIDMFHRVTSMIAAGGLFITGLSLFVGGIGIMNIMFVSVAERTREIGVRKALGARQRTILIQFLIEAAAICLLGGLVGVGLAWPLSLAVGQLLPTAMSFSVVGLALLVAGLTGLAAGFFPAWRAARLHPVDALRKE